MSDSRNAGANPFPRGAARFLISAATPTQWPADEGAETVFIGRSNAGKSSVLNALCGIGSLARTSRSPGRTRLFNFFALDDAATRRLVDVPGYGFARASIAERRRWRLNLERFLAQRRSLRGVVLIMDARHPLQRSDWELLATAHTTDHPVHVLLNKADKLSRSKAMHSLHEVQRQLESAPESEPDDGAYRSASATGDGSPPPAAQAPPPLSLQLFSALKGDGVDDARACIASWLADHR